MESGAFKKKRKNYAQVSNAALLDKSLSLKAKGLYALIESLLSIPNFTLYKDYLISCSTDGKSAFDSAWKELKDAGYLKQDKIQTHKGFIYEYELLDSPDEYENSPGGSSVQNANAGGRKAEELGRGSDASEPQGGNSYATSYKGDEVSQSGMLADVSGNKEPSTYKRSEASTYRKSTPGKSRPGEPNGGNPTHGESVPKNNMLESNMLVNNNNFNNNYKDYTENVYTTDTRYLEPGNTIENNSVVAVQNNRNQNDLWNAFNSKIAIEKERTKQAYQLPDECFDQADLQFAKLLRSTASSSNGGIMNMTDDECWEVYRTYLLLKKYLPDEFDESPRIRKTPEAYVIGMIKSIIGDFS